MQLTFSLWKIYMHVFLSLSSEYTRASCRTEMHRFLVFTSLWCICVLFSPSYFHNISAHGVYRIRFNKYIGSLPALPESQLFYKVTGQVNRSFGIARCIIFYYNKNNNLLLREKWYLLHKKKFLHQYIFLYKFKTHDLGTLLKIFYTFSRNNLL